VAVVEVDPLMMVAAFSSQKQMVGGEIDGGRGM
jgi:hypothetical protein